MTSENTTKANQLTHDIKLTSRIIQWMDFLHLGDETKLKDFLEAVYDNNNDAYLMTKLNLLRQQGVWTFMSKLDNRNTTRFYKVVMHDTPMNWWMQFSTENRKVMQEMIENAIEQVTDRIEEEVNTRNQVMEAMADESDNLPTPEDLGAEPRETFDEHKDEE